MSYIVTNWLPILLATLAGLLVGCVDYGVRGRKTAVSTGRRTALLLPIAVLAEFWLAAILAGALILAPVPAGVWTITFGTAVVIWIGFIVPVLLVTTVFVGRPIGQGLIDCGHWLLVMLIQAAVLRTIGLMAPS